MLKSTYFGGFLYFTMSSFSWTDKWGYSLDVFSLHQISSNFHTVDHLPTCSTLSFRRSPKPRRRETKVYSLGSAGYVASALRSVEKKRILDFIGFLRLFLVWHFTVMNRFLKHVAIFSGHSAKDATLLRLWQNVAKHLFCILLAFRIFYSAFLRLQTQK